MRFLKIFLIAFVVSLLLFRGPVFRATVKYQELPSRNTRFSFNISNPSFKNWIDENSEQVISSDVETIIDHALYLTAQRLEFTLSSAQIDPNKLYLSQKANCIGYASFFNTVFNYLIQKKGLNKHYLAKQLVGKLELLSFDLHRISDHPFLKDHDFSVVSNEQGRMLYYVDPVLYDYLKIRRISLKSNGENQAFN